MQPLLKLLRWRGPDFKVAMRCAWACPHCGKELRPWAVQRDGNTLEVICESCLVDACTIELDEAAQ